MDAAELSLIAARRMRPERVSRYFACLRRGLAWLVSRSITSTAPMTRILPAAPGSKKASPSRKGIFRLIDLDNAFERLPHRIDHRPSQLLSQQPRGFVSHPEL